eukprot:scaffold1170_cov174-Amphora_coffeaeformis.AAC.16
MGPPPSDDVKIVIMRTVVSKRETSPLVRGCPSCFDRLSVVPFTDDFLSNPLVFLLATSIGR